MRYLDDFSEYRHDWIVRTIIWCIMAFVIGIMASFRMAQEHYETVYISNIDKFYLTYQEQDRQWRKLFPGHEIRRK